MKYDIGKLHKRLHSKRCQAAGRDIGHYSRISRAELLKVVGAKRSGRWGEIGDIKYLYAMEYREILQPYIPEEGSGGDGTFIITTDARQRALDNIAMDRRHSAEYEVHAVQDELGLQEYPKLQMMRELMRVRHEDDAQRYVEAAQEEGLVFTIEEAKTLLGIR